MQFSISDIASLGGEDEFGATAAGTREGRGSAEDGGALSAEWGEAQVALKGDQLCLNGINLASTDESAAEPPAKGNAVSLGSKLAT